MPPCRSEFSSLEDSQHIENPFGFLYDSGLLAAGHQVLLSEKSVLSFFVKMYSFWRQNSSGKDFLSALLGIYFVGSPCL